MLAPRGYYEGAMTTEAREPTVLVRNVCYCLAMIDFSPRLAVVFLSVGWVFVVDFKSAGMPIRLDNTWSSILKFYFGISTDLNAV